MLVYFLAFLIGFIVFVGICGLCFLTYKWSDDYLYRKGVNPLLKDIITYILSFCLAFGLAILSAPLMGHGKNPILDYFGK